MTRRQLADASGVKERTIRFYESPQTAGTVPNDETLFALAEVFEREPIVLRAEFAAEQPESEEAIA